MRNEYARRGDPDTSLAAAEKLNRQQQLAVFALLLGLDPTGERGLVKGDIDRFLNHVAAKFSPAEETLPQAFGVGDVGRSARRWGLFTQQLGWVFPLGVRRPSPVSGRGNHIYVITARGRTEADRAYAKLQDPELFWKMIDTYEGEVMPSGQTITSRIGDAIKSAWEAYENPERTAQARGRVIGLAQALAIIRYAPATPTAEQVRDIAEEFRP